MWWDADLTNSEDVLPSWSPAQEPCGLVLHACLFPCAQLPWLFSEVSNPANLSPAVPFTWGAYLQELKPSFLAEPTKTPVISVGAPGHTLPVALTTV